MKTLFIEAHSDQKLAPAVKKNLAKLNEFKKIGLFTTVQHIQQLVEVKQILEKNGVEVLTRSSSKSKDQQGPKATYCGQLLGCDATAAVKMNVDAFLYVGTGEFHPIAISLKTDKPVLKINPFTCTIECIDTTKKKKWLAKQAARLSKLQNAKKIGILLSTKPGQYKPKAAEVLAKKFSNSYRFITDMISADYLLNFPDIDLWINTACPRLIEDSWPKTMINADDIL
jgi:2-(3-amino-3-carboxypropyl)histidine synthase